MFANQRAIIYNLVIMVIITVVVTLYLNLNALRLYRVNERVTVNVNALNFNAKRNIFRCFGLFDRLVFVKHPNGFSSR